LRRQLAQQPATLIIAGLLLAGILHGSLAIFNLALAQWQEPHLYGDSFAFVQRDGAQGLLGWLTAQHNEHRIVWAKAASMVETEVLKIPPGQSALFQNLALILGCAGLWCWLCHRLLHRLDLRLITALAGWLILLNPWQYENLSWEFQTPWFLINALVLACALLLNVQSSGRASTATRLQNVCALLLPWIALSSSGQGLAVSLAFAGCSWLHSRRLGILVSISTGLAGITFYGLLHYAKPSQHPELTFQLGYFLKASLGGPWQGLAVLCVVIAAVLLGRRQTIAREHWPSVLMPGLFSLLFAGMITLSRAGFGLEQANSSRYVSHSLMLGLSALLALALIDDQIRRRNAPLLGGFLVLLATLGSFPQAFQSGSLSYSGAWAEAQDFAEQHRESFACNAQQNLLKQKEIRLIEHCQKIFPNKNYVDQYFKGALDVKPIGWHHELQTSKEPRGAGAILHVIDDETLGSNSLRLRGWAFEQSNPRERLYIIANYGISPQLASPVNKNRSDVMHAYKLKRVSLGFDASFPLALEGRPLQNVRIGTPFRSVDIWENRPSNG
jgi:hypothetical protein